MSGKKNKQLRKRLYGDSDPSKRNYVKAKDGKLISDPIRRIYQRMKKALKGV